MLLTCHDFDIYDLYDFLSMMLAELAVLVLFMDRSATVKS